MACEGVCTVEQNEVEDAERPKGTSHNGAPFEKPNDSAAAVPEATSDADIWDGQDFGDYTESVLTIGFDYTSQWGAGVKRVFPDRRQLDCKDAGCSCKLGDKPTVVEDWTDWQRHEIHVPHVVRGAPSGTPPMIKPHRLLLKGAVRHRKRILQGVCRHNRNITIIAPFKTAQQESD